VGRRIKRCHNPSFGFTTQTRGCKVAGHKGDSRVTSHAPKRANSVREWTFTLLSELPCWGLESQMDFRIFKLWFQGSKPICWKSSLYHWKALNEGYNFASNLIAIEGLHTKLCAPKVVRILVMGILGLPLGSPKTKSHLDVAPVKRHKIYYKGEGGGFPQVWAMVSLMNLRLPMARPNTKSAPTMH
jgi:hypothetical protein